MNVRTRRVPLAAWGPVLLLALATACLKPRTPVGPPAPAAWREWPTALAEAERMMAANQRDSADGLMAAFATRWSGTPEAEEGTWWRIVRQAERVEDSASTALVVTRIDSIVSASPGMARRADLLTLRRLAVIAQQLRRERALARAERDAESKAHADEVEKLKAELEEVKAELERVRKRVTRRRP